MTNVIEVKTALLLELKQYIITTNKCNQRCKQAETKVNDNNETNELPLTRRAQENTHYNPNPTALIAVWLS